MREEVDRDAANRKFADDPLKLERISELGDDEVISTYTDGTVHRPLPRAARAEHGPAQALQAAQHRGRVLAGRFAPPDAAAHLRHRLLQEGRARGPSPPAGGGAQARPPPARQGARPLHVPSVRAGRRVLDRPGHDALQPARTRSCASCSATSTRRSRRRCSTTRGCGRSRGTGASTRRTCSSCSTTRRGSTTVRSSR